MGLRVSGGKGQKSWWTEGKKRKELPSGREETENSGGGNWGRKAAKPLTTKQTPNQCRFTKQARVSLKEHKDGADKLLRVFEGIRKHREEKEKWERSGVKSTQKRRKKRAEGEHIAHSKTAALLCLEKNAGGWRGMGRSWEGESGGRTSAQVAAAVSIRSAAHGWLAS